MGAGIASRRFRRWIGRADAVGDSGLVCASAFVGGFGLVAGSFFVGGFGLAAGSDEVGDSRSVCDSRFGGRFDAAEE